MRLSTDAALADDVYLEEIRGSFVGSRVKLLPYFVEPNDERPALRAEPQAVSYRRFGFCGLELGGLAKLERRPEVVVEKGKP